MGMGSLMSTAAINKLGTVRCLIFGGLGNVIWIASTILPAGEYLHPSLAISKDLTSVILIVAAMINGFTIGILWTAANHYVADCSSDKTKGLYFSFFWALYMSS